MRGLRQLTHKGFVVQVAGQGHHLHAFVSAFLGHGFELGHFAPSQDQVHTALGQRNGTGTANASAGTGDQSALAAHGAEVIEHGALHQQDRASPWGAR